MTKEYYDRPEIISLKVFANNKNLNDENELIQVIERGLKLNLTVKEMIHVTKKAKPLILSIINSLKQNNDNNNETYENNETPKNNDNKIYKEARDKGYLEGIAEAEKRAADYYKKIKDDNALLLRKVDSLKEVITEKNNALAASELKMKKDRKLFFFVVLPVIAFVFFSLGFFLF